MQWTSILDRIASGESAVTEFKQNYGDRRAIGRTICAFANTLGGVLILGVTDSREIVGVKQDPEKVQERLTAFLQSGCSAPVSARLGSHKDTNGWVHWLEVPRQRGFEPLRFGGRVWVRRGRSSVEPSPSELHELYNMFGYILTEERAIDAASVEALDFQSFRVFLKRSGFETEEFPQPSREDDLRNRGAVVEVGGRLRATLYGVLAFGREPQSYPQTRSFTIGYVAYDGVDRSDRTLIAGEALGRVGEQVDRAAGWIASLGRVESYEGLRRTDRFLLPLRVLREALVNAVAHRDYAITGSRILLEVFSDRVDLTNPGLLPNHMTVASVMAGGHPRSRNELVANYLQTLGYMEQRGRGWPIMRREMQQFNGTTPELIEDPGSKSVRVTFKLKRPGHW